eukprot:SAG31_NODE_6872_length_1864_cov_3.712181_1_plen_51_part_00
MVALDARVGALIILRTILRAVSLQRVGLLPARAADAGQAMDHGCTGTKGN